MDNPDGAHIEEPPLSLEKDSSIFPDSAHRARGVHVSAHRPKGCLRCRFPRPIVLEGRARHFLRCPHQCRLVPSGRLLPPSISVRAASRSFIVCQHTGASSRRCRRRASSVPASVSPRCRASGAPCHARRLRPAVCASSTRWGILLRPVTRSARTRCTAASNALRRLRDKTEGVHAVPGHLAHALAALRGVARRRPRGALFWLPPLARPRVGGESPFGHGARVTCDDALPRACTRGACPSA